MDHLLDYATHWFEHTALRSVQPNWQLINRQRLEELEAAHPGICTALRHVAREHLATSEPRDFRHRALALLEAVGDSADIPSIDALTTDPDSYVAGAARAAIYSIAMRAREV